MKPNAVKYHLSSFLSRLWGTNTAEVTEQLVDCDGHFGLTTIAFADGVEDTWRLARSAAQIIRFCVTLYFLVEEIRIKKDSLGGKGQHQERPLTSDSALANEVSPAILRLLEQFHSNGATTRSLQRELTRMKKDYSSRRLAAGRGRSKAPLLAAEVISKLTAQIRQHYKALTVFQRALDVQQHQKYENASAPADARAIRKIRVLGVNSSRAYEHTSEISLLLPRRLTL